MVAAHEHEAFVRGIVRSVASQFSINPGHEDDLRACGMLGVAEALARFNPARGIPFTAFAYHRVRGAILDGVRSMGRLPRRAYEKLKSAEAEGNSAGETPGLWAATACAPAEDDEDAGPLADALAAENRRRVLAAINALPERERFLVRGFHLDGRRLDELANEIGLSKSRASRICSDALKRIEVTIDRAPTALAMTAGTSTRGGATPAVSASIDACCARLGCDRPPRGVKPGTRGPKPRYCSTRCRDAANYQRDVKRIDECRTGAWAAQQLCKCGSSFTPRSPQQRYCSPTCDARPRRKGSWADAVSPLLPTRVGRPGPRGPQGNPRCHVMRLTFTASEVQDIARAAGSEHPADFARRAILVASVRSMEPAL